MSRHEGVSCDVCGKSNFRGKRFKCLICYDYDLCCGCYDNNLVSGNHSADHAMQCIITRADHEIYFGDAFSFERAHSFTCPHCGMMGLTERRLQEHMVAEHSTSTKDVLCPLCAALGGYDTNTMTDNLVGHMATEHTGPRQHGDHHEEAPNYSSTFSSRMLHEARRDARREARAAMFSDGGGGGGAGGSAGGGGGGGGGGRGGFASSHRSPFSYASLRRSHPQAFASAEREARSSSANAAAVAAATGAANTTMSAAGLFPPYSPPSPTMPQHANVRLVPSSMNVLGGNEGGGGGSGDSYQVPDISQNLVDFIAQMSQSEDRNPAGDSRFLTVSSGGNQYVLLSGNGTEGVPPPTTTAEQRRLERQHARRYFSAGAASRQSAAAPVASGLNSQWECLMGTSAPVGEFVLASSLDDAAARVPGEDSEADQLERQQRAEFGQELVLSLLDVTLDAGLLEHLEQLSSESEHES